MEHIPEWVVEYRESQGDFPKEWLWVKPLYAQAEALCSGVGKLYAGYRSEDTPWWESFDEAPAPKDLWFIAESFSMARIEKKGDMYYLITYCHD